MRVIGSTPKHSTPRYYVTLLTAMDNAESSIWITAAYFVPRPAFTDALADAAERGVRVRVLVPGEHIDKGAVRVAVHRLRRRYRELLREEISKTLLDPAQADEEMQALFSALAEG